MKEYLVMKTVTFTIKVEAENDEEAYLMGVNYDEQKERLGNGDYCSAHNYEVEDVTIYQAWDPSDEVIE
tara:strand:+ start:405 stop:611 length:207 start_codon:yes stop_codon:yes gene_type:complete